MDSIKGVRIEGLVSKHVIKSWLEEWDSMQAGSRPMDAIPSNSGPKTQDGVSNSRINIMMLDAAITDLPPVLYICLMYRWVEQMPLNKALERTGIAKSTYYRRCDKAVDYIYYHVNGIAAGMKDLIDAINKK